LKTGAVLLSASRKPGFSLMDEEFIMFY